MHGPFSGFFQHRHLVVMCLPGSHLTLGHASLVRGKEAVEDRVVPELEDREEAAGWCAASLDPEPLEDRREVEREPLVDLAEDRLTERALDDFFEVLFEEDRDELKTMGPSEDCSRLMASTAFATCFTT